MSDLCVYNLFHNEIMPGKGKKKNIFIINIQLKCEMFLGTFFPYK